MNAAPTLVLVLRIPLEPNLAQHAQPVDLAPRVHEREIEAVAIERGHDGRSDLANVLVPALDRRLFVRLVEDGEGALVFRFRRVLKVLDVFADDLSVGD